jgi:DNA-binding CsgD family transcriptional regulator
VARTDTERARLAVYRRGRAIAAVLVLASLLLIGAIGGLALANPDAVLRSPVIVFVFPALIWIALNPRAHWQWWAARRDAATDAVETVSGPARLRQQSRPGLFAGPRDRLLVGDRVFAIDAAFADTIVPGQTITVRYAPQSGALLSVVEREASSVAATVDLPDDLSRRERELLSLIAEGLTDKEIARRLNLSPSTVRTYNSALYQKLGVTSRTQAIRIAKSGS